MSFIKDHLLPILHGTIAHFVGWLIITAAITSGALLALIKLARVSAFSMIAVKPPLWSIVFVIVVCILLLIRSRIRKRIKIRSANYGKDFAQTDVTNRVRAHVQGGVLDVLATTEELC